MNIPTKQVVVVGGGAAGWLTAAYLAREHATQLRVLLIESPDVPIIGVGEGTWPSMRSSLQRIGISEQDLLRHCEATFKQGTQFMNWYSADSGADYVHPFSLPADYSSLNLAEFWRSGMIDGSFASAVTPQATTIAQGLAPKLPDMPGFAYALNYGYHFDARKFAGLLCRHAVEALGVEHIKANVSGVLADEQGFLTGVQLDTQTSVEGQLFIDCTGQRALLLGGHFGVPIKRVNDVLPNNRAIVTQVAHPSNQSEFPSTTHATAQEAGWIWDIALQTRRGLGYVHAAEQISEDHASAQLQRYLHARGDPVDAASSFRTIAFEPGYRETFWIKNCLAIGLSAGFVEPLEASALALVEQSAMMLVDNFPKDPSMMLPLAQRFNDTMHYHWQGIIEFLKLHYLLSQRDDTTYWRRHRDPDTWPQGLAEKMTLWRNQAPWHLDRPRIDELFPAASYQYVLLGMQAQPGPREINRSSLAAQIPLVDAALHSTREKTRLLTQSLHTNRSVINAILADETGNKLENKLDHKLEKELENKSDHESEKELQVAR